MHWISNKGYVCLLFLSAAGLILALSGPTPKISGKRLPNRQLPEGGLIEFHGMRGDRFPLPESVSSSNDEKGRLQARLLRWSIDRQTFNSERIEC